MSKPKASASAQSRIQIIVLFVLLAFTLVAYFLTPEMKDDQRLVGIFLLALLAGFATYFISGKAWLSAEASDGSKFRFKLSATAGLAMFASVLGLLYLVRPHWHKASDPRTPPESHPTPSPTLTLSIPAPSRAVPATPNQNADRLGPAPTVLPLKPTPIPTASAIHAPTPFVTPSLKPSLPVVSRTGRVLLLIEDQTILQRMLQK